MYQRKENIRKFKRIRFVFPVRLGILDVSLKQTSEYIHAFSDNISEDGLKIILDKDFKLNTKMELRFDLIINDDVKMICTKAEIKWKKENKNGSYEYGIHFELLSDEEWTTVKAFMEEYCI